MTREMRFYASLLALADLAGNLTAWGLSYWIRFDSGWISMPSDLTAQPQPLSSYAMPAMLSLTLYYWAFRGQSAYRPRGASLASESVIILRGMILIGPVLVALIYLLYHDLFSRGVLVFFFPLSLLAIVIARSGARLALDSWLSGESVRRRLIAIGGGPHTRAILQEYLQDRPDARLIRILEPDQAVEFSYEREKPDEVVIIFPQLPTIPLEDILRSLESQLIDVRFIPNWSGFRVLGYDIERAGRWPVIHLRRSPLFGWGRIGKRTLDLVLGSIALVITAPLLALIALLVWMTSGRPVLFSQSRMGFDAKVFKMYKFRSMVAGAEQQAYSAFTQPNDPRRTGFGAWMRRAGLDELPQLYNILKGDMSLVGPRPERPHLVEDFRVHIPHYYLRHKVKAGLTGWAQIHGLRGNTSLEQRLEYDLYYIEHWSLWLDVKILALTLVRGWSNAY